MSNPRLEWRVGLFVGLGLVLLAGLMVAFSKGLLFFQPTYEIALRCANVGGLKPRAAVLMSGVRVGTAERIQLAPDGRAVTVSLRIYSRYTIHQDAQFVIEQSGVLGDQYVAIVPTRNEGEVFGPGKRNFAVAEAPFNLQEFTRTAAGFLARTDATVKRLNDALEEVSRILLNPQTLTNLATTVQNLRTFSVAAVATAEQLSGFLDTNAPALAQSSSNLMVFSDRMRDFAGALNDLVATNGPDVSSTLKNVESSAKSLNSLLNDVQAGKGVAGALLTDQQTAAHVESIAHNLSITTSNLNRLGLWGILWKPKPPKNPPPERLAAPKDPYGR